MFSALIGNNHIKYALTQCVERDRIGHSLLFAGPEGIGKSLFAMDFAKMILSKDDSSGKHIYKLNAGTHPDLHIYRPEGKTGMHSITTMRSLAEEVYLPPYEARRKIFIIHDADRMLSYSANALLKTFEEPSPETVIILLSHTPDLLLPTILSRCSVFHFQSLNEDELTEFLTVQRQLPSDQAQHIAKLSQGSIKKALRLVQNAEDPMRKSVLEMLAVGKFESYTALAAKAKEIASQIEDSVKAIESSSKEEFLKGYCDKLSASQRESLEKEIDGIAAVSQMQEANTFFELLMTWHRDLHVLRVNGDQKHILNSDYLPELQKMNAKRADLLPLETLLEAVKTTKTSLARSTTLHLCLENLFLRLDML